MQLINSINSTIWVWVNTYRYIFSGMNIHLPAILGFTRYQGFDPSPYAWRMPLTTSSRYIVQWYTIRADGATLFFLMERCQCNFVQKLNLGPLDHWTIGRWQQKEHVTNFARRAMNEIVIPGMMMKKWWTGWWFGTWLLLVHNIWDVILPIDFHIFQDG